MGAPTTRSAQQRLDEVYRAAHVASFDVDGYLVQLRAEVEEADREPRTVEARDAQLREALAAIDSFASRAMRVQLDALLAADTAIAPQFRTYLATQVLDYQGDLELLRTRVADVVARTDPGRAADTAAAVAGAAGQVLALRDRLRRGVIDLARVEEPPEDEPPEEPKSFFELIELD